MLLRRLLNDPVVVFFVHDMYYDGCTKPRDYTCKLVRGFCSARSG
jgi:hypothetical protein